MSEMFSIFWAQGSGLRLVTTNHGSVYEYHMSRYWLLHEPLAHQCHFQLKIAKSIKYPLNMAKIRVSVQNTCSPCGSLLDWWNRMTILVRFYRVDNDKAVQRQTSANRGVNLCRPPASAPSNQCGRRLLGYA